MVRSPSLVVLAIGLVSTAVSAQQQSVKPAAAARAPAVASAVRARPAAPRIDGVLDETAWVAAPVFSDFLQQDPNEGQPASEPTEFRVLYTNDALFIAVRAYDSEADEIAAILARRDQRSPSDEVTINIDSYHDRRSGFSFTVNAAGVKRDAYLFNDNEQDDRWDAVWDVKTTVDAEGWTAEFRIPFSQLRFSPSLNNTFGFNVTRRLRTLQQRLGRLPVGEIEEPLGTLGVGRAHAQREAWRVLDHATANPLRREYQRPGLDLAPPQAVANGDRALGWRGHARRIRQLGPAAGPPW